MSLGNGGWIKLHRKILDNWIWEDPEKLRAWIDILLMVNHEDKQIPFDGHIVTIHKGQRLTSLLKLSERWGWSRNRVDRFLRLLEEAKMVTADRTPNGTVLTVINWALYQDERDTNGATDGATNDTTVGATVGTQTRMNKNDKEGEEVCVSAPTPTPSLEDVKAYCRERDFTHVDVEKFWNFYDSKNWMEGGVTIKWKQRLAYWEAKDIASSERKSGKKKAALDEEFWEELREKARKEDEERAKRERNAAG